MKPSRNTLRLLLLFPVAAAVGPLLAQVPRRGDPAALRARIEELRRQREALETAAPSLPAIPSSRAPAVPAPRRMAGVCFVNEMPRLRAVWRFEPLEGQAAAPIAYPVVLPGEQWLSLPAGRWRMTAEAGDPATGESIALGAGEADLIAGRRYEIDLEARLEPRLRGLMEKSKDAQPAALPPRPL